MSSGSWLSPFKIGSEETPRDNEDTPLEYMDFEALAEKVGELRYELDRARDMCEQANIQFNKYRTEIYGLKQRLNLERDACIKAHRLVLQESNDNRQLRARNKDLQASLNRQTVHNAQLEARLTTETSSLRAMTKHARSQEERLIDTQLDLEYLRCTTNAETLSTPSAALGHDAPLPAQPFVVVLVDGDAYKWAADIALNDIHLGTKQASSNADGAGVGAMAATRIRTEVTKYILAQNDSIPITSKIITRGFCNFGSSATSKPNFRMGWDGGIGLAEFAVQFTEKLPLFDFFDAGRGKERADDKIRENFHIFLSTPNCHAIFLAACLDNGFARMLEQYSDHPQARQKIVLVSPGYVAIEIQQLGLTEVQWPSVFLHRTLPPELAAKYEREKSKHKQQRARVHRSVSAGGSTNNAFPGLMGMLPGWNLEAATLGRVSPRLPKGRAAALEPLDLAGVAESNEEVD